MTGSSNSANGIKAGNVIVSDKAGSKEYCVQYNHFYHR